ncbi:MAG: hypothetical protein B7X78_02295, partial [Sphingomonadales bacterium 39-62-4]
MPVPVDREDDADERIEGGEAQRPPHLVDGIRPHGEVARAVAAEEGRRQAQQPVPQRALDGGAEPGFHPQHGQPAHQFEPHHAHGHRQHGDDHLRHLAAHAIRNDGLDQHAGEEGAGHAQQAGEQPDTADQRHVPARGGEDEAQEGAAGMVPGPLEAAIEHEGMLVERAGDGGVDAHGGRAVRPPQPPAPPLRQQRDGRSVAQMADHALAIGLPPRPRKAHAAHPQPGIGG